MKLLSAKARLPFLVPGLLLAAVLTFFPANTQSKYVWNEEIILALKIKYDESATVDGVGSGSGKEAAVSPMEGAQGLTEDLATPPVDTTTPGDPVTEPTTPPVDTTTPQAPVTEPATPPVDTATPQEPGTEPTSPAAEGEATAPDPALPEAGTPADPAPSVTEEDTAPVSNPPAANDTPPQEPVAESAPPAAGESVSPASEAGA